MSNLSYWEKRQVQDAFHYFEEAEKKSSQISSLYYRASRYLSMEAEEVFEKYKTKHGLSEAEAKRFLNTLQDKASLEELLQKLKNSDTEDKKALKAQLEAPAYGARLERMARLQQQIDNVMQNVYAQEKIISTEFYTSLAKEAYYRSIFHMQQRAEAAFSFSHISAKTIERVLNSRWSGENYSKRIWENTQSLGEELKEELLLNLITGRTEWEAAECIANRFGKGNSYARRLIRTESNYMSTMLNLESYTACGVKEYQFLATLDLRTSELCRELDGTIFPVSSAVVGKNCPPMHPWCRSTTVSVVDRALLSKLKRAAIDPKTGKYIKVPRDMTYKQWYEKYVKGKPEVELEEKKTKNRSSDRTQYRKYKEIFGKDIPETLDEFQNLKYNETEKWSYTKLDYKRRAELLQNPEKKLPNAENVILPEGKFTKYLFDGEHSNGLAKGRAISSRLGYSIENWQEFRDAIQKGAVKYPAVKKESDGHGQRYEQKMVLMGLKNNPANVVVGWIQRPNGEVSMTSAYLKEV